MNVKVKITDVKKSLNREQLPSSISELANFRKDIKDFQNEYAIHILENFFDDNFKYSDKLCGFYRFYPQSGKPDDRRNVGLFSTALCLRAFAAYKSEIKNANKEFLDAKYLGLNINSMYKFISFIFRGLHQDFPPVFPDSKPTTNPPSLGTSPGFTANIVSLCKLKSYINEWDLNEQFGSIIRDNEIIKKIFEELFKKLLRGIAKTIWLRKEVLHPFILYKILRFLDLWKSDLLRSLKQIWTVDKKICFKNDEFDKDLNKRIAENIDINKQENKMFQFFFDEVYFLAKYELYRQMALKLSGDLALYDDKRMIYSLLIVSYNNRFSNNLIAKKALSLIFQTQRDNPNALWPTGQLIPISIDSMTAISSIESAYDLLSCKFLSQELIQYLPEIKSIYDFHVRTLQIKGVKLMGWYPPDQRDKTPTSFTTAFALLFIKKFYDLLSETIQMKLKESFRMNFKKPVKGFDELYDSTGVKCKLRLFLPQFRPAGRTSFTSAILYGPPGTGKTSYARALAKEMKYTFLELTPGDFYSGGETQILERINSLFEQMLHLNNTVIFIDEIDDLVMMRDKNVDGSKYYDPRSLYVNTLLPRFQELHLKKDIILILATNHINKVDSAILRLGRIDLLIPVGGLSPHARLKMLYNSYTEFFGPHSHNNDKFSVLTSYLTESMDMNYSELRSILDRMVLIDREKFDPDVFKILVTQYFDKKLFHSFRIDVSTGNQPHIRPKSTKNSSDYIEFNEISNRSLKDSFLMIFDIIENGSLLSG